MVGILDTNDNWALGAAAGALEQAHIVYDVVPIADVPDNLKNTNPKWRISPSRILVSAEDEAEARGLVEPFHSPIERSEVGSELERDRLGSAVEPRWRLVTFRRVAVILGIPLGATFVVESFHYSGVISEGTIQSFTNLFGKCFIVGLLAVGVGIIVDAVRE
jgi:hypothetical protein